jgi:hypothetical protein
MRMMMTRKMKKRVSCNLIICNKDTFFLHLITSRSSTTSDFGIDYLSIFHLQKEQRVCDSINSTPIV